MNTNQAPTKKELLERLLEKGMVMVHLDARKKGVDVPSQFRDDADLRLNLSYGFRYRDLRVEGDVVSSTLSFGGQPYTCVMPLGAIFAIVGHATGEGYFFPTDAPPEALAALAAIDPEAVSGLTAEEVVPSRESAEAPDRTDAPGPTDAPEPSPAPAEAGDLGMDDPLHPPPRRPLLRAIDGGLDGPPPEPGSESGPELEGDEGPDQAAAESDGTEGGEQGGDSVRRPPWLRVVK